MEQRDSQPYKSEICPQIAVRTWINLHLRLLTMADNSWAAFQGGITSLTAREWIVATISAWLAFKLLQALYNISPLHPLSKVPGPKLAGATYLPEFYHDVILVGRYTHAIKKMHEKYG